MSQYVGEYSLHSIADGTLGFRIDGANSNDFLGSAITTGDVNGDGYADLILGAQGVNSSAGALYVVYGGPSGFSNHTVATSAFEWTGGSGEGMGRAVGYLGDINHDGFGDFAITDDLVSPGGKAYVVFGSATGPTTPVDLTTLDGSTTGFSITGASASLMGASISGIGDINDDGIADFAVGAIGVGGSAGTTYVILGTTAGYADTLDLSTLNGTNGFKIVDAAATDQFGFGISSVGDFNGDGVADFMVSAPLNDAGGRFDAGSTYIIFGKDAGFNGTGGTINLSALGANGVQIAGPSAGREIGVTAHAAGDVNGDGLADIIIGAPYGSDSSGTAGDAYVIYGKTGLANIDLATLTPAQGFKISGVANGDLTGVSVAGGGDVNGDGFADVVIGARNATPGSFQTGAAYVVFGGATGANVDLATLAHGDGSKGFELDGRNTNYAAGQGVSMADVNGDGLSDVIVSAPNSAENTTNAGSTYVMFGVESTTAVNLTGTSASQTLVGSELNDTLNGLNGNDTIHGNGGDDLITGGVGNDTFFGGTGNDGFAMGANFDSQDHVDGGVGTNDQIQLNGDYSNGLLVLNSANLVGVEVMAFAPGHDYTLTTANDFLSAGQNFTFWSVTMASANHVSIGASADVDGHYTFYLGQGADFATGGGGGNLFYGEGGRDTLTGGGGADTFAYLAVTDSTGNDSINADDRIIDFTHGVDHFQLPVAVTGVDTAITHGGASFGSFNTDLAAAVDGTHLAAHRAVLFTSDSGSAIAHTFLIVDANGVAGYQAGADFVFEMINGTLTGLSTADFTT
jgi:FG-GAP repeat/RTX calcium-binding nonapeptide repeat (4 copies)